MFSTDPYVGIPFVPDSATESGCDCTGLVELVYRLEFGISVSLAHCNSSQPERAASLAEQQANGKWARVSQPTPGDVVCFAGAGGFVEHVGIYVGNDRFLHASITRRTTVVERISRAPWSARIEGYYRWER